MHRHLWKILSALSVMMIFFLLFFWKSLESPYPFVLLCKTISLANRDTKVKNWGGARNSHIQLNEATCTGGCGGFSTIWNGASQGGWPLRSAQSVPKRMSSICWRKNWKAGVRPSGSNSFIEEENKSLSVKFSFTSTCWLAVFLFHFSWDHLATAETIYQALIPLGVSTHF